MMRELPKDPLERANFPQGLGDAFSPRSRRSGRALLHGLAAFGASIAIAGCKTDQPPHKQTVFEAPVYDPGDLCWGEISGAQYNEVREALTAKSSLRPLVRKALESGHIDPCELSEIRIARDNADRDQAKRRLRRAA